ncbi:MAG: ATP-binding cassette domain-containing protein [Bacillati bacterium ANGP1]|uniref:ATP-binding cassette domain-containing protein n=1 Tax=Candidatus Segetimicrobium genomatis TaxID=2569760 RepID=A0A537JAT6_9BACT|nr:MAG: ATP-binding cassette domain-containing protein [Terrabacteria group bacterium ANGP1]
MLWVDRVVAGYHPGIDILDDLTLRAEAGRITAVIGPNGAGKSTLLRVVFGLLPPRGGRVLFREREIQGVPADARKRMGIGYVPQGPSTFPQMTVEENLLVGGWTIRHDRVRLRDRLEHVYALFPALAGVRRVRATVSWSTSQRPGSRRAWRARSTISSSAAARSASRSCWWTRTSPRR